MESRMYRYVGPRHIAEDVRAGARGAAIRTRADLARANAELARGGGDALTFVVDDAGVLRVADRRSEHVACAGGGAVYAAGELRAERQFDDIAVVEISNQSTGY